VFGLDDRILDLGDGGSAAIVLLAAVLLGLRHATDPDHIAAVTTLVASSRERATQRAARLGAWWGLGHAATLLMLGVPLIVFKSAMPAWLESGAEKAVGAVIIVLAIRVIWKWARGQYRSGQHRHHPTDAHRHLRRGESPTTHRHHRVRTPRQAFGLGLLHGLAGTGAVVVLLLAALPTQLEAGLALAVFAPMTIVSMAACTTAFAWVLTRPVIEPVYRAVLIPALGLFGMMFGLWYVGLG
jgi:ABC-type nickel/cobalt efflux system permease component RcnA